MTLRNVSVVQRSRLPSCTALVGPSHFPSAHGGGLRGRDRRRAPVPHRPPLLLLGGTDPEAHRVDRHGDPGSHQPCGSALVAGPPPRPWSATQEPPITPTERRIAERWGRKITRIAAALKLLTLVYYGMRDGRIRCLAEGDESPAQPRREARRTAYRVAGLMAPTTRHVLLQVRSRHRPGLLPRRTVATRA